MDKKKNKNTADETFLKRTRTRRTPPPRGEQEEEPSSCSHLLSFEDCEALERLIMRRKWCKTSSFLINAYAKKEVKRKRRQRAADGRRRSGKIDITTSSEKNILSLALWQKAPIEIIEAILQIEAQLSLIANPHGMLPIHIACACGLEYGIVRLLLKHDHGKTAYKVDFQRKTPIHHLAHYVCHPQDVGKGLAFGEYVFEQHLSSTSKMDGGDTRSRSRSSKTSTDIGSGRVSKSFWKRKIKKEFAITKEPANTKEQDAEEFTMSITQDQFADQLKNFQQLAYVGPLALFCRDETKRTPTDILHDCKADFEPDNKPARWERADISCLVIREELTRYYIRKKKKEEELGQKRFGIIQKPSDCPTVECSTVSGSVSLGLSNLEVESISLGQMDLSVTSLKNKLEEGL